MKTFGQLSLFFPCLNDAKSLPRLIQKADIAARKVANNYEILVINDGSIDNTKQVLDSLQQKYSHLRVITHTSNKGYGAALKSGFANAKYEWIFYTDGDGQYDPSELTLLVSHVTPNIDVVNGYKKKRADHWIRVFTGMFYNHYSHMVTRLPIRDIDCDFRLIRKSALSAISLESDSGAICLELISKLYKKGAKFAEVAVHHYPRRFGQSEFFRLSHLLSMVQSLMHRRF